MEGELTLKSKVFQHFQCTHENKKLETALQELIILTTTNKPQDGYSDFERERVMDILHKSSQLLYKLRKIHLIVESHQR